MPCRIPPRPLSLLTRALRLRCAVNDVMVLAQDKKSGGYYPNMAFAFGTKVDKAICEKAAAAKAPMGTFMKRDQGPAKNHV